MIKPPQKIFDSRALFFLEKGLPKLNTRLKTIQVVYLALGGLLSIMEFLIIFWPYYCIDNWDPYIMAQKEAFKVTSPHNNLASYLLAGNVL